MNSRTYSLEDNYALMRALVSTIYAPTGSLVY